jgi:hypothetical protein
LPLGAIETMVAAAQSASNLHHWRGCRPFRTLLRAVAAIPISRRRRPFCSGWQINRGTMLWPGPRGALCMAIPTPL